MRFHLVAVLIIIVSMIPFDILLSDSSVQPSNRTRWLAENEQIRSAINFPDLFARIQSGDRQLMRSIDFLTYQKLMQVLIYERDRLRSDPNYLHEEELYKIRHDITIYHIIGFDSVKPIQCFFYGIHNTDPRIRKRAYYHVSNLARYFSDFSALPLQSMVRAVDQAMEIETVPQAYDALEKMKRLITRIILIDRVKHNPILLKTIEKEPFKSLADPLDEYDTPPIMTWDASMLDALFAGLQNKYLYVKFQCVLALKHLYTITPDTSVQNKIRLQMENLLLFIDEMDLYLGCRLAEEVAGSLDLQPRTPDRRVRLPEPAARYQRTRNEYHPHESIYGFGTGTFHFIRESEEE
jgi:hypothetical protein